MFCQEQLEIVKKLEKPFVAHFDATGSLIRENGKRILIYALCAMVPLHKIKALPILEFVSDEHDRKAIKVPLNLWKEEALKIIELPEILITDFSWALLHSVSESFNDIPLRKL